jgi:hypothetical protein
MPLFLIRQSNGFPALFIRVARWYILIPKMSILVHFSLPWDGNFGVFHGRMVFFCNNGVFNGHLDFLWQF